jgi:hypothetical protein
VTPLAPILEAFFTERLINQRRVSPQPGHPDQPVPLQQRFPRQWPRPQRTQPVLAHRRMQRRWRRMRRRWRRQRPLRPNQRQLRLRTVRQPGLLRHKRLLQRRKRTVRTRRLRQRPVLRRRRRRSTRPRRRRTQRKRPPRRKRRRRRIWRRPQRQGRQGRQGQQPRPLHAATGHTTQTVGQQRAPATGRNPDHRRSAHPEPAVYKPPTAAHVLRQLPG